MDNRPPAANTREQVTNATSSSSSGLTQAVSKGYQYLTGQSAPAAIELPFCTSIEELARIESRRSMSTHIALESARNAVVGNRSTNTAYILLLGRTGVGKSTAVNFLFDMDRAKTSNKSSCTDSVIEYNCKIQESRLLIDNHSISIIDGPGLLDTEGREADAITVLTYKKFLQSHPQLRVVKPNFVFVVIDGDDGRLGKPSQENRSETANVLRTINAQLADTVVDRKRNNVVFILTKLHKIDDDDFDEAVVQRAAVVKEMSAILLGIHNPPVVWTENKIGNLAKVEKVKCWYRLKNGQLHPLHLFTEVTELATRAGDMIGEEAVAKFFSQKSKIINEMHVYSRKQTTDEADSVTVAAVQSKIQGIQINLPDTETTQKLQREFATLSADAQRRLQSNAEPTSIASFLNAARIQQAGDVPDGSELLETLLNYPGQITNDLVTLVFTALNRPVPRTRLTHPLGCCFNAVTQQPMLSTTVVDVGAYEDAFAGIQVPAGITLLPKERTSISVQHFDSMEEYVRERASGFGIQFAGKIPKRFLDVHVDRGCTVGSKEARMAQSFTTIFERSHYQLQLKPTTKPTAAFLEDLNQLPTSYKPLFHSLGGLSSASLAALSLYPTILQSSGKLWADFFRKYGTHVIETADAGGACIAVGQFQSSHRSLSKEEKAEYAMHLQGIITGSYMSTQAQRNKFQQNSQYFHLDMAGGNTKYHVTSLDGTGKADRAEKWLRSLKARPEVLEHKLGLVPLSRVVCHFRPELGDAFKAASHDIYEADFSGLTTIEAIERPPPIPATREEATNQRAPKSWWKCW